MKPIKIDHVAVVVEDMETALYFWQDALGLSVTKTESNEAEAVDVAFLPIGESNVELLVPTTQDSGIAKYVEKRGTGIHHLCIAVSDIEAVMANLSDRGVQLINEAPRTREDGIRYAFVHPKSTGGVLLELYEAEGETS